MIKAIIFDCYGVLAEDGWLPFKRQHLGDSMHLLQAFSDLGKQNEYGMISNEAYYREASRVAGVDESELREAVGRQVPNIELFEYISTKLKPKYKIGLISNANYDVVNELFTPEQAKLFDVSVLSHESRMIKPDSRMFLLATEKLGVSPEECIFIDDVERYCSAASLLGMKTITFRDTQQCIDELEKLL